MQTGIAAGIFGSDQPYELLDVWQVGEGLTGFLDWWNKTGKTYLLFKTWAYQEEPVIVSEQFVLRSNPFVADTTPIIIEGALVALCDYLKFSVTFQQRTNKALVNDSVLKEHGLWHTGKQVQWKDARDTNDAIIHALAFLKTNKHIPTLEKYWGKEN